MVRVIVSSTRCAMKWATVPSILVAVVIARFCGHGRGAAGEEDLPDRYA
jgi:hypothetical protein